MAVSSVCLNKESSNIWNINTCHRGCFCFPLPPGTQTQTSDTYIPVITHPLDCGQQRMAVRVTSNNAFPTNPVAYRLTEQVGQVSFLSVFRCFCNATSKKKKKRSLERYLNMITAPSWSVSQSSLLFVLWISYEIQTQRHMTQRRPPFWQ